LFTNKLVFTELHLSLKNWTSKTLLVAG